MATAIGLVIDIPIIIRSLSQDFYYSSIRNNYSIPLDRDFLMAVDAGITPAAGPGTAAIPSVDKFHLDWWCKDNIAVLPDNLLLNVNNIDVCLAFHRHEISLLSDGQALHPSAHPPKPRYIWKPNATTRINKDDICKRCRLYRAVAMGSQDDYCDIRNQVHAMETSFATKKEQALRRASGFNQLFEYLTIKELDPTAAAAATVHDRQLDLIDPPELGQAETLPKITSKRSKRGVKAIGRRAVSASMRGGAVEEVAKFHNMPSLKWTWGVDMDNTDLLALRRSVDNAQKLPHSGYDTSLEDGSDTRSTSTDSHDVEDLETGYFSDISDEARRPVPNLKTKHIPDCLYRGIREKPNIYLVSLRETSHDSLNIPIDQPAAVPFIVPPPMPHVMPSPSQLRSSKKFFIIFCPLMNI